MNPWKRNVLGVCRDVLRFAVWFGLVLNGVMLAIFSIAFTGKFLWHLWTWCNRVLFPGNW